MKLSTEHKNRAMQALEETKRLLAKELKYMSGHQKPEMIESYRKHIVKLGGMINA
ncbi:MAG: hypothetical protein P1P89_22210 [Desulfobacterales bacterium]|nr:hypothetical protein [Desulfobacterales bacterium]